MEEPFIDSGSEYVQSSTDASSENEVRPSTSKRVEKHKNQVPSKKKKKMDITEINNVSSEESSSGESVLLESENEDMGALHEIILDKWVPADRNFQPRKNIPTEKPSVILANLNRSSTELEVFFQLFPKSLFLWIAEKTNERLVILQKAKKNKSILPTDQHEIMIVFGCFFIMSYNKVPAQRHYWSTNSSLGNKMIKQIISRNRFQLLSSKFYFNSPEKPDGAHKLYYIEEVVSCLKHTFSRTRTDSTFQSIDEAMAKFKGRSCLKQYLPLKPIKRGIKLWVRSDSKTGYTYDFNIYSGRDENKDPSSTLGEQVVTKLASTIKDPNVSLCFDRFFTSSHMMNTIPFAAVGTSISNRKNMPKFEIEKSALVEKLRLCAISMGRAPFRGKTLRMSQCFLTAMDPKQPL